ncbi:MAG: ketoacyl-ACP synthase III [Chitinophagia bacterium]|nr:ketoacyl-ACP synthase III [Chitinophagia bacterium]
MPDTQTVITGIGSYIPNQIIPNGHFLHQPFFDEHHQLIATPPEKIIQQFQQITGIQERRYTENHLTASQLGTIAAERALAASDTDPETIDQLIVAHNFGDVPLGSHQCDMIPALASRIKHALGIRNPSCVAYDIIFGCPGWIQGVLQADAFIRAAIAKKCLVIGTETLSRVIDKYDRDSMIFSDGAGAAVIEVRPYQINGSGILSSSCRSDCGEEAFYLSYGCSNHPTENADTHFIKMKGRKVYEYAMKVVPEAMQDCIQKAGIALSDVKKFFLHQANEKMDEGFIKALYKLYGESTIPAHIMPMSIHQLGNSSVATIPTLYDLVINGTMPEHQIYPGDIVVFASVGAGMNINAFCYRV